jgi:hypothetical protein
VLFTRLGTAEGIKRESEDGSIGNTQAETWEKKKTNRKDKDIKNKEYMSILKMLWPRVFQSLKT